MIGENEPISPDEFILRMVWRDFYRKELACPVLARAFKPREDEIDGISLFREGCLRMPEDALSVFVPEKRSGYAICRLSVAEVTSLGLSVRPATIIGVAGHVVISELNTASVAEEPRRWRNIQVKLADLASKGIIRLPIFE